MNIPASLPPFVLQTLACLTLLFSSQLAARAADHGDSPSSSNNSTADLADIYLFLDPNDNSQVVMAMTARGFIVPGEAVNFASFDPSIQYRIEIENTGDAKADRFIHVSFSPRTATNQPQTATVTLPNGRKFTAPTTIPTLAAAANPPTITTDPVSGVSVFAGEVDDPFFFDIPGFARFVASVNAGSPNPAHLMRGRDTFAGYNILAFAARLPSALVRGSSNVIGVSGLALRAKRSGGGDDDHNDDGGRGRLTQIDREGNPAVNVALIPFARKDAYNAATPRDDARGRFVPDILATLAPFGTDDTSIGILAGIAVTRGDYLRVDLSIGNAGLSGGTNPEAAFPNGRRLGDDVIDTLLTVIANRTTLGDSVSANDVPLRNEFPFFAAPQQPRAPGVIDDNTRN